MSVLAFGRVATASVLLTALLVTSSHSEAEQRATASATDLVGLWKARRRFGPDTHGPLILQKILSGWIANFRGRRYTVGADGTQLSFQMPDSEGSFEGRLDSERGDISDHWTFPRAVTNGSFFAVPVLLTADGPDRARGTVVARDDEFTLYLMVQKRSDGSIGAFLRNPERNHGVTLGLDRIVRDGNAVTLIGRSPGQAQESKQLAGRYDPDNEALSITLADRGGTYDFRRDDAENSGFYPRGRNPGRYVYRSPPLLDDGWQTATLDEVDIDSAEIERFIQQIIDMPMDSMATPEIQGILIVRHGKLVFEEYFHGEHRNKLHDTRSTAKSLTTTLIGAAMQAGAPLDLSTPVYEIMNGGTFPADLERRKRAMTLEHLLMMRSGYFCDDSNPDAPGNENRMTDESDEPDYYRYTLTLPLDRAPGEKGVYCSIDPNLALGMLSRATGESLMVTFDRLIGAPMQISHYAWLLDPAGHPYGGGSVQFILRGFLNLGQLMLDGGTWKGHRILSPEFAARASSALHELKGIQYGYRWWSIVYPYKDRTVRAYFAGGNGG